MTLHVATLPPLGQGWHAIASAVSTRLRGSRATPEVANDRAASCASCEALRRYDATQTLAGALARSMTEGHAAIVGTCGELMRKGSGSCGCVVLEVCDEGPVTITVGGKELSAAPAGKALYTSGRCPRNKWNKENRRDRDSDEHGASASLDQ